MNLRHHLLESLSHEILYNINLIFGPKTVNNTFTHFYSHTNFAHSTPSTTRVKNRDNKKCVEGAKFNALSSILHEFSFATR